MQPLSVFSMSQSTLKNRKAGSGQSAQFTTTQTIPSDYVPMEAESSSELFRSQGATSETVRVWWLSNLTGKHRMPPWHILVYNYIMEMIGVFVLGMVVSLGTFVAGPSTNIANGLALAAAVAATYLVMTRLYSDYAVRRHLNPMFTVGYLSTGDIGIPGLFYYMTAQTLGAVFSGLTTGAILSEQTGSTAVDCLTSAACTIQRATVPLPTLTNDAYGLGISLTTVVCLEIFVSMIITLVLLLREHLNTQIFSSKGYFKRDSAQKNYKHAVKCAALATFVFIAVGYPIQVTSFNSATYLTGLFSGILTSHYGRQIATLATLPGTQFLANSVFGATGSAAWALYFFGPLAGAVAASMVGYVIMWLGFKHNTVDADLRKARSKVFNRRRDYEIVGDSVEEAATPLLVAAQTTHTAVSDLVNPYSMNSAIASSVLK